MIWQEIAAGAKYLTPPSPPPLFRLFCAYTRCYLEKKSGLKECFLHTSKTQT